MRKWMMFVLCALWLGGAVGREAPPVADDPVLEQRVQRLSEQLRCLVCQNQNLADSHAELAIDLKNQVRSMLQQGATDQAVIEFMVQRYGDFVLYKPPVKGTTLLLWGGPFVLLVGGLATLFVKLRQRRQTVAAPLADSERVIAHRLLHDEGQPS